MKKRKKQSNPSPLQPNEPLTTGRSHDPLEGAQKRETGRESRSEELAFLPQKPIELPPSPTSSAQALPPSAVQAEANQSGSAEEKDYRSSLAHRPSLVQPPRSVDSGYSTAGRYAGETGGRSRGIRSMHGSRTPAPQPDWELDIYASPEEENEPDPVTKERSPKAEARTVSTGGAASNKGGKSSWLSRLRSEDSRSLNEIKQQRLERELERELSTQSKRWTRRTRSLSPKQGSDEGTDPATMDPVGRAAVSTREPSGTKAASATHGGSVVPSVESNQPNLPPARPTQKRRSPRRARRIWAKIWGSGPLTRTLLTSSLLVFVVTIILLLPPFYVQEIEVTGLHNLDAKEVIQTSGLHFKQHLLHGLGGGFESWLRLRYGSAEDRILQAYPNVAAVRIRPFFPSGIQIDLQERLGVAYIHSENLYYVVDREGVVLSIAEKPPEELPVIEGLSPRQVQVGRPISSSFRSALTGTVQILSNIIDTDRSVEDDWRFISRVRIILPVDRFNYYLSIRLQGERNLTVHLGDLKELQDNLHWLRAMLKRGAFDKLSEGMLDLAGKQRLFRPGEHFRIETRIQSAQNPGLGEDRVPSQSGGEQGGSQPNQSGQSQQPKPSAARTVAGGTTPQESTIQPSQASQSTLPEARGELPVDTFPALAPGDGPIRGGNAENALGGG